MAGININVDDSEVRQMFERLKLRGNNLKPAMKTIGAIIQDSVRENFDEGGRYSSAGSWKGGSERWRKLAPATVAAKKNKNRILFEEGDLYDSIHYRALRTSVLIGSDRVYAATHQFGREEIFSISTRRRLPEIPARPFLVIQDDDLEEVEETIGNNLTRGF